MVYKKKPFRDQKRTDHVRVLSLLGVYTELVKTWVFLHPERKGFFLLIYSPGSVIGGEEVRKYPCIHF